jgi:hypothetical protein
LRDYQRFQPDPMQDWTGDCIAMTSVCFLWENPLIILQVDVVCFMFQHIVSGGDQEKSYVSDSPICGLIYLKKAIY